MTTSGSLEEAASVRNEPELPFAVLELRDFGLDAGYLYFESGDFLTDFGIFARQCRQLVSAILDAGAHVGDAEQFIPFI